MRNSPEMMTYKKENYIPAGKLTQLWKITMFNGKTPYKLQFSIAMLNLQRVIPPKIYYCLERHQKSRRNRESIGKMCYDVLGFIAFRSSNIGFGQGSAPSVAYPLALQRTPSHITPSISLSRNLSPMLPFGGFHTLGVPPWLDGL